MADAVLKQVTVNGTVTDVTVTDGKISRIGKTDAPGRDCGGAQLFPGLIDIHTHGMGGVDTMDGTFDALARQYAAAGTTSLLATTMTCPVSDLAPLAEKAKAARGGAHILGLHLEGPYLSAEAIGAQDSRWAKDPDFDEIAPLPGIRMITVAPERDGALDFIRKAKDRMTVCIGHTKATYEQALAALDAGANCLTHTCNAMPPLLHRAPGPIGAALMRGNTYVQVICDGIHLHPAMVLALYRMFGAERMILISDSMRATGLADGIYDLGGQEMTVSGGVARTRDGALAGSTSTLLSCVQCAIRFGIPPQDAFRMATATPASLIGIRKGVLAVGYDADFLLLDENYRLLDTLILS